MAQHEWDKTYDRIKANAQKVDVIAERDAFEAYQQQCGLPIDSRYHDSETGYTDNLTGRAFDRWDAWLARASAKQQANNHTPRSPQYGKLKESLIAMIGTAETSEENTMHYHNLFRIDGLLHCGVVIYKGRTKTVKYFGLLAFLLLIKNCRMVKNFREIFSTTLKK